MVGGVVKPRILQSQELLMAGCFIHTYARRDEMDRVDQA